MNKKRPFPEIVSGKNGWKVFDEKLRPRTSNISKEMYVPLDAECEQCGENHSKMIRRHELGHVKWSPLSVGKLKENESETCVAAVEEIRVNFLLATRKLYQEDTVLCEEDSRLMWLDAIYTKSKFTVILLLCSVMRPSQYAWTEIIKKSPNTPVGEFRLNDDGEKTSTTYYQKWGPSGSEYRLFHKILDEVEEELTKFRYEELIWCISKAEYLYYRLIGSRGRRYDRPNFKVSYRKTRDVAKELFSWMPHLEEEPKPEEVSEKERAKAEKEKLAKEALANSLNGSHNKRDGDNEEDDEYSSSIESLSQLNLFTY